MYHSLNSDHAKSKFSFHLIIVAVSPSLAQIKESNLDGLGVTDHQHIKQTDNFLNIDTTFIKLENLKKPEIK